MGHPGLAVLAVCVLTACMLYFSLIVIALRTYSFAKLQEACKSLEHKSDGEPLVDAIVDCVDRLAVTCSWCRLFAQMALLLLLMLGSFVLTARGWLRRRGLARLKQRYEKREEAAIRE